jgi:cyanophycinase
MKPCISLLCAICILALVIPAPAAAQTTPGLLIPMGGGYSDVYAGFSQAAVANAREGQVNILVLGMTYSSNADAITEAERQVNLRDANERRFQIEEACKRAAPPEITCAAILAPIFVRSDAEDPANLELFSDDLAAIFILGGDQTVAMRVLAGTPAEARITELHQKGAIIAGTSAGGGMQAAAMLAGYNQNYAPETALSFGAADVWNSAELHGLPSSLQSAILDQHFHQRGRLGRLLNAILLPGVPHVGVGVDAYTGVLSKEENLSGVFGLYTVTILDAETYHAADGVQYVTYVENRPPLLSVRNVLVNLLSPGEFSYDLKTRAASLAAPAPQVERAFEALTLPEGAGTLLLAGDLSESLAGNPILAHFKQLAGGNILVIATGYTSARSAETNLKLYAEALGGAAQVVAGDAPVEIPAGTSGILIIGKDQSKANPAALEAVRQAWLAGTPVLADNAAAPLLGSFYSAHGPTPGDAEEAEAATQKSFWQGKTEIKPGLGLVNISLEPQVLADNRFGRLFSLAYNHPELVSFGLNKNTAIELDASGARALGENAIFVLDLRTAKLALGTNQGFVIANGLLDVFAAGEDIAPALADVNAGYTLQPTPILPTVEPTAAASPTLAPSATPEPVTATEAAPAASETPAPLVQPPASALPQAWGIILGLALIVGAVIAARLLQKRK